MSDSGGVPVTEDLYWEVEEKREAIDRQLRFTIRLWHEGNENCGRVADAVGRAASALRKEAHRIQHPDDRRSALRAINRILSVLSFLSEYLPYVEGSGGQRPARPRYEVESVTSAGLPGHGKRR